MHAMAVFGIVVLSVITLTLSAAAILLFPDFLRYIKIRSL